MTEDNVECNLEYKIGEIKILPRTFANKRDLCKYIALRESNEIRFYISHDEYHTGVACRFGLITPEDLRDKHIQPANGKIIGGGTLQLILGSLYVGCSSNSYNEVSQQDAAKLVELLLPELEKLEIKVQEVKITDY